MLEQHQDRPISLFQHDSRPHILSRNLPCLTWKRISSTHFKRANTLIGNGKGSFQSSSIPSGGSMFPRLTRYMKYHRPKAFVPYRTVPFHFISSQICFNSHTTSPSVITSILYKIDCSQYTGLSTCTPSCKHLFSSPRASYTHRGVHSATQEADVSPSTFTQNRIGHSSMAPTKSTTNNTSLSLSLVPIRRKFFIIFYPRSRSSRSMLYNTQYSKHEG